MSAKPKPFFRQIGPLSRESSIIIGLLEMGLNGEACRSVGIHTSPTGLKIMLNGRKICSGRTARECLDRFDDMRREAKKS